MTTDTSSAAYQELKQSGRLNEEQVFTHRKLARYGPATGMELHEKLVIVEENRKSQILGPERVRKRLPELAQKGLAMRIDTRPCRVTGKDATVWAAVQPD